MKERLIRIKEVMELTGKSRSAIYADMAKDIFPKSILIGARTAAWQLTAIEQWIQSKIKLAGH
jgi:prophage regulatory protein